MNNITNNSPTISANNTYNTTDYVILIKTDKAISMWLTIHIGVRATNKTENYFVAYSDVHEFGLLKSLARARTNEANLDTLVAAVNQLNTELRGVSVDMAAE